MGKKEPTAVMSFHTTTDALAFKEAAESAGLRGRLAPIPRQLSAGCGMAWRESLQQEAAGERVGKALSGAEALRALALALDIEYEQLVELPL